MIDLQTVKFIGFLNDLAEKSKDGIRPFSVATAQDRKGLFYDDHNPITVFPDRSYPLVNDCFIKVFREDPSQMSHLAGDESDVFLCFR